MDFVEEIRNLVKSGAVGTSDHAYGRLHEKDISYQLLVDRMGRRIEDKAMKTEASVKLVQQGNLVAKIPVTLIHDETGWSPYLSHEDMLKLDDVREAIRRGDVAEAARFGHVFEMTQVA